MPSKKKAIWQGVPAPRHDPAQCRPFSCHSAVKRHFSCHAHCPFDAIKRPARLLTSILGPPPLYPESLPHTSSPPRPPAKSKHAAGQISLCAKEPTPGSPTAWRKPLRSQSINITLHSTEIVLLCCAVLCLQQPAARRVYAALPASQTISHIHASQQSPGALLGCAAITTAW
jgi:hypothetical protein